MQNSNIQNTNDSKDGIDPVILNLFGETAADMEKTDDNGTLQIYSYKTCTDSSSDKLKQSRGVVFAGERFVCRSIGYTPEYVISTSGDNSTIEEYLRTHGSYLAFFPSFEGTLLRMFHYDGKWYISTHRKLDVYQSKWGNISESFGQTLETALTEHNLTIDTLCAQLNTSNAYFLFLSTTANTRMVSYAPSKPTVSHIGTLVNNTNFSFTEKIPVPTSHPISFSTVEDVVAFVRGVDYTKYQGLIAFFENGNHFKLTNETYHRYSQVRGNEPSVMFRYLQVRSNPEQNQLLRQMYAEKTKDFAAYENAIIRISKIIHTAYFARFVSKQQITVSQEEYAIIRKCHGWHIDNRETNKVTFDKIKETLTSLEMVSILNRLIKRFLRTGTLALKKKDESDDKNESNDKNHDKNEEMEMTE